MDSVDTGDVAQAREAASRYFIVGERQYHRHGWKPDRPDVRDRHYAIPHPTDDLLARLPARSIQMIKPWDDALGIYDQGPLGSCTANMSLELFRWNYWKARKAIPALSRLAQYAWTRGFIEGTPLTEDSGCQIRDSIKSMAVYGCCPEQLWPYDVAQFADNPPQECLDAAAENRILSYHSLPGIEAIKQQIANWYPVGIGFTCYESLESAATAQTGVIPIPEAGEKTVGGHAIALVGYDDTIPVGQGQVGGFYLPQSWGRGWGRAFGLPGWGVLPYWYFTERQASDFWVVHVEEGVVLP